MNEHSKAMEVQQILHMNGGTGETSYAKNSASQSRIISMAKPIIEKAILDLYFTTFPEAIRVADLGCSSGPNTLLVVSEIMNIIEEICHQLGRTPPEFHVFLNDLPGNDFNTVFRSLTAFHEKRRKDKGDKYRPCFIAGVPGSFYGRLFPSRSLHFVHSSSSLHWLSQVPPGLNETVNKGKIYISNTSPAAVQEAYLAQFQRDFSLFLKSRSEELVPTGRIVFTVLGRTAADPSSEESCILWELLAQSLRDLVSEGLVEEQKLNSFNAPYYAPSSEEIVSEILKDGCFSLDCLEVIALDWSGGISNGDYYCNKPLSTSHFHMAKAIRAVAESMLQNHFGQQVMDPLFQRFGELLGSTSRSVQHISFVVSLIKK
ncbi:probable methyltransferase TCM_000168 [Telopea speciosissima]|uniref:probable methyltransferase TCM_000168 n=1 Tax=Telopea speciosissima TaxID=54955 RepID=UPI001CC3E747|nr:probable methyltransferase TCM_000168 [Telopea speciosissima]